MEDPVLPSDGSFSLVTVIPVISFHWYHSLTDRAACRERQVVSLQAAYPSGDDMG